MTTPRDPARRSFLRTVVVVGFVAAAAAAGATALLVNILERKHEAEYPFFRVVTLDDDTTDPATWGKNFPLQYDGYQRTVDQQRTRNGGSEAVPREPTAADPRSIVSQSRLDEDPRLKTMWAGYAFAVDFREERGHAYMLEDQTFTERQQVVKQPGTCLNCHASMVVAYRRAGDGDPLLGFERINAMPYAEARALVDHAVACIDCHDPQTMALRVTRPAFVEGLRAYRASQGVADYDPNRDATRQEMRSFVCGQCHVEYYFRGPDKRLVYPWANGLRADEILEYYDSVSHKDWTHADSGASALKAQHPEFEMWSQGIHAIRARRRAQGQRPPRAQPAAEREPRVPDMPQGRRGRAAGARRDDPGPDARDAQRGHGCPRRADRRPAPGRGRWRDRPRPDDAARFPAPGAVPARLRRGGELDGVPCRSGGAAVARPER
jgi:nitrite reductase (cytochrome c-552)